MMFKTENAEKALEAENGEEAGREGEQKPATDTTEDKSSTEDAAETFLVASKANQEGALEKEEKANCRDADENAVSNNELGLKRSESLSKSGSSASSPERLEEIANKLSESKEVESKASVDLEASVDQGDETNADLTSSIISSSKKAKPSFKYDPNKITLRFLFANRDGIAVTIECNPSDTVGDVKGALILAWPEDAPPCATGENLRLVCMGKGFLMPDTRTLEDIQIPTFKTHPTPINVSIKPAVETHGETKDKKVTSGSTAANNVRNAQNASSSPPVNGGCPCSIL